MSFKEIKKQRVEKTLELQQKIKEKVDSYAEKIANDNIQLLKQENIDWDKALNDYLNNIYNCLEENYLITLENIRKIYNINITNTDINIKNILKLTYQKDGLTLEERITKHFNDYKNNKPTKERILYDELRILNTESLCVMNNLIRQKIKKDFEYGTIEESECCEFCQEWMDEGPLPISDFEEPPYHPNCECIPVYFTEKEIKE